MVVCACLCCLIGCPWSVFALGLSGFLVACVASTAGDPAHLLPPVWVRYCQHILFGVLGMAAFPCNLEKTLLFYRFYISLVYHALYAVLLLHVFSYTVLLCGLPFVGYWEGSS